jgi:TonB family protein
MVGRLTATACVLSVVFSGLGYAQEPQNQAQDEPQVVGPVYRPGNGVRPPSVLSEVKPVYTEAGMRAGIAGEVQVDAVVTTDGRVAQVTVARSLDRQYGLDEAAVEAAKQWRFNPGTREGEPVNTRIVIILDFRTHDSGAGQGGAGQGGARRGGAVNRGATQTREEFEQGAWREGAAGVTAPTRIRIVTPRYTSEAMQRKIQGVVGVDAVVMPDGTVDRARVAASLDAEYGLDEQALEAALQSTFEPNSGTLGGNPVPVIVRLTLEFRIH